MPARREWRQTFDLDQDGTDNVAHHRHTVRSGDTGVDRRAALVTPQRCALAVSAISAYGRVADRLALAARAALYAAASKGPYSTLKTVASPTS